MKTSSTRGLKGGGKGNKRTTWDYGRLAKAVSLVSERDATSKNRYASVHVGSHKKDQLTKLVICDITLNALFCPFMFAPPANLTFGEF